MIDKFRICVDCGVLLEEDEEMYCEECLDADDWADEDEDEEEEEK